MSEVETSVHGVEKILHTQHSVQTTGVNWIELTFIDEHGNVLYEVSAFGANRTPPKLEEFRD